MKSLFPKLFFLLLIGQINAFGSTTFRNDDVNPLKTLKPSLTLKANVYFGDQDEVTIPIAETDFYLLKESLIKILKDSKFEPTFLDNEKHELTDQDYLTATARAFYSDDEESQLLSLVIKNEISRRKISQLKTNILGEDKIKTLNSGSYYFFGIGRVEDEIFVWHFPVNIKLGSNILEIDQHNAEVVFFLND